MARVSPAGGEFPLDALRFILEALHRVVEGLAVKRHISGQELLAGVCALARREFDYLAPVVLDHWGLRRPQDVGRAVFQMVEMGALGKRQQDTPADFDLAWSLSDEILRGLDHLSELRAELKSTGLSPVAPAAS